MAEPPASHRALAPVAPTIPCALLTVSDTRTEATDVSGAALRELLTAAGHPVAARALVPDEPAAIRARLEEWIASPGVAAIISTGGTGLARRDTTIEVVRALLTTELDGFGELFRMISYDEIGSAAMLSRAVAGLVARPPDRGGDTFLFALPGSPNAVRTACVRLIVPELPHLVGQRRDAPPLPG